MTQKARFWKSTRTTPLLWEFLISLLQDVECREFIRWIDENEMTFKIVDSYQVATLWGDIKGRPHMNQNKLRRAIRQYYKSGVMKKVKGQKGGYKFEKLPYNPFSTNERQILPENNTDDKQEHENHTTDEVQSSSCELSQIMHSEVNETHRKRLTCFVGHSITGENVTAKISTPKFLLPDPIYTTDSVFKAICSGEISKDLLSNLWLDTNTINVEKDLIDALINDVPFSVLL